MKRRRFIFYAVGACCAVVAARCTMNVSDPDAFLSVEESLCMGCGQCAGVCKGDAITIIDNKAFIDPARCILCGNCVKVCPYDAIS